MPAPNTRRVEVLNLLSQVDEAMTLREMARRMGCKTGTLRSCFSDWRRRGTFPLHIREWEATAKPGKFAPAYAISNGKPDAKPPRYEKLTRKQIHRRSREKHHARILAKERAARGSCLVVSGNPFSQLLHVAGATHVAAKARK